MGDTSAFRCDAILSVVDIGVFARVVYDDNNSIATSSAKVPEEIGPEV
jgi:hypothetical protein